MNEPRLGRFKSSAKARNANAQRGRLAAARSLRVMRLQRIIAQLDQNARLVPSLLPGMDVSQPDLL